MKRAVCASKYNSEPPSLTPRVRPRLRTRALSARHGGLLYCARGLVRLRDVRLVRRGCTRQPAALSPLYAAYAGPSGLVPLGPAGSCRKTKRATARGQCSARCCVVELPPGCVFRVECAAYYYRCDASVGVAGAVLPGRILVSHSVGQMLLARYCQVSRRTPPRVQGLVSLLV
jgi:hypothetical protein